MNDKPVYRRYVVSDRDKTVFGLYYDQKDLSLEIKTHGLKVRIITDDRCYNTGSCLVDDSFYKSLQRKDYSR